MARVRAYVRAAALALASLAAVGVVSASAGTAAAAAGANGDAGAAPFVPACVQIATSSRWVPYGYNHIVALKNGCSKTATCDVSTDVAPERRTVSMAPGESIEVVTFLGAASATFTARVDCRLH